MTDTTYTGDDPDVIAGLKLLAPPTSSGTPTTAPVTEPEVHPDVAHGLKLIESAPSTPAAVSATPPPVSGIGPNLAAGAAEGAASVVNTINDPVSNMLTRPLATGIVFAHDALAPYLGYDRFPDKVRHFLLDDTSPAPDPATGKIVDTTPPQVGTQLVNKAASALQIPTPDRVVSATPEQSMVRSGAAGAVSLAPFGPVAALVGAGGGIAADRAESEVPDWAKPATGAAVNLLVGAGVARRAAAEPVPASAPREPATVGGGYVVKPSDVPPEAAQAAGVTQPVETPAPTTQPVQTAPTAPASAPAESTAGAQQTPAGAIPPMPADEAAARQTLGERTQLQQPDSARRVGGINTANPIPDYHPTLGTIDLNHAPEELVRRQQYPQVFKDADSTNNDAMVHYIDSHIPDDLAIRNMDSARGSQADADIAPMKANPNPVDIQPVADLINRQLESGAADRPFVRSTLQSVKDSMTDADGNLRTDPNRLYEGARKNITDMLARGKADPASNEATATAHLMDVKDALDAAITKSNPSFQTYLNNYSAASRPIDAANIMNQIRMKVVNAKNEIPLENLNGRLKSVFDARNTAAGANDAKSLTPDQLDMWYNVRNQLQANAARDNYGRVVGSNTVLNLLQNEKYTAPKPSAAANALTFAGESVAHGVAAHYAPFVGNPLVRYAGQKIGESRAAKSAQAAAAAQEALDAARRARVQQFINPQIGHNGGPPLD